MKITKNRIKEIIFEELNNITENESLIRQIVMEFVEPDIDETGRATPVITRIDHLIEDLEAAVNQSSEYGASNNISDLRGDNL
tara:strand:+ start:2227 stop:2475 length:249 start_codon:yes stop_codon:yes gene_type:complete